MIGTATQAASQQATADVAASSEFLLETAAVKDLRAQWIVSVDSVNGTHLVLDRIEDLLVRRSGS